MISVEEAAQRIRRTVVQGATETVPTLEAGGRVLRRGVTAERAFPPFDRVMMDGIGLSGESWEAGERSFRRVGTALAGTPRQVLEDVKGAIEVSTGAIVPKGVDLVIPSEQLEWSGETVRIAPDYSPPAGGFIHRRGSDAAAGSELLHAGRRLDSRAMAVAVSCGASELVVSTRPRIAVVSTGDELVDLGQAIEPHQVRRSNVFALERALLEHGFPDVSRHHFGDAPEALREGLQRLVTEHDFVLLSGGISAGQHDFVPETLRSLGAEIIFHRVAQRPGKPMLFAKAASCLVFGLPGNPVSTLIGLYRHVFLALDIWCGTEERSCVQVTLSEPIMFSPPLTWFLPVALEGIGSAAPRPVANSGDFAALLESDGFIQLPAETNNFAAGFAAPFYPW